MPVVSEIVMIGVKEDFVGRIHHKVPAPLEGLNDAQEFSVSYCVVSALLS
jgi:hypothetical protein